MRSKLILSLIVVAIGAGFIIKTTQLYKADILITKAEIALEQTKTETGLEVANKAIRLNPQEPYYYRQRARIYIVLGKKDKALADLTKAYELNPNNLATLRNNIPLYYFLSVEDIYQPTTQNNLDQKYIAIAKQYLSELKHRFPNDVGTLVDIAKYEQKLGLTTEFAQSVEQIKVIRPDLLEWHEVFITQ